MGDTDSKGRKPDCRIYAIVSLPDDKPDLWLDLGPVWQNRDGSFSGTMHTAPVAWGRGVERRFVIQWIKREEGHSQNS